jgi:hypothetical protein
MEQNRLYGVTSQKKMTTAPNEEDLMISNDGYAR